MNEPSANSVYTRLWDWTVVVLQCCPSLSPYLLQLFSVVMNLDTYYPPWHESMTVILRKPGKPDYSLPTKRDTSILLGTKWMANATMRRRWQHVYAGTTSPINWKPSKQMTMTLDHKCVSHLLWPHSRSGTAKTITTSTTPTQLTHSTTSSTITISHYDHQHTPHPICCESK